MKNTVKELTEGMQRLCAVANRIVAKEGDVGRIEADLLLEDLRRLYDVGLRLAGGQASPVREVPAGEVSAATLPDRDMHSSTVMAAMAAMGPSGPAVGEERVAAVEEPMPEVAAVVPAAEPAVEEPVPGPVPEAGVVAVEPESVRQPLMEELEGNGNGLLFDEVVIEPEASEGVAAAVAEVVEELPAEAPAVAAESPRGGAVGQASLLDYLKRPVEEHPTVRTLGDTLGSEPRQATLERKVEDLRTVININDKFSFMSELFHNNMKAYNDFILRLNAIDNRDEALLAVSEVSAQQRWDEGSLAVQSFYRIFDKKF